MFLEERSRSAGFLQTYSSSTGLRLTLSPSAPGEDNYVVKSQPLLAPSRAARDGFHDNGQYRFGGVRMPRQR